jgi:hypothetical protein
MHWITIHFCPFRTIVG